MSLKTMKGEASLMTPVDPATLANEFIEFSKLLTGQPREILRNSRASRFRCCRRRYLPLFESLRKNGIFDKATPMSSADRCQSFRARRANPRSISDAALAGSSSIAAV